MRLFAIVYLSLLTAIPSVSQEMPILQLYRNLLANSPNGDNTRSVDIFGELDDVRIQAASEDEISAVAPLALQCIRSSNGELRKDGFVFFLAAITRPDSGKAIGPYIDNLGALLNDKDTAPRRTIFYILGSLQPKPPEKAIAYLEANLENSRNSSAETITIAVSLIKTSPNDNATVHKVLSVVTSRSDDNVTGSVIRQLGLSRTHAPEAIGFISTSLDSDRPGVHESAVDAASRLNKDQRAFSSQLARIASDPKESPNVRNQAAQALKP